MPIKFSSNAHKMVKKKKGLQYNLKRTELKQQYEETDPLYIVK